MVDWEAFYSEFRRPDFVAGYEILNRLGGGAFGEVYKARKRSIGKAYAIKFLKVDQPRAAEMVERELAHARLFASIEHPNLVAIEDLGSVAGVPYVVMGYAGEDTLARRLAAGRLDRRLGFDLFVQVCRGVLALHDRQLVHFDLKPSNVFLRGDVARVGDYGLAKLLVDGRQTLSIGRGTPHYMAPEVLKGRADQRADLYSLGVILFEIFAGRVPFEGESGLAALLREEDPELEYPSDFPLELRAVVERCLALDPGARHPTAAALLEALGQTGRAGDTIAWPWDAQALRDGARDPGAAPTNAASGETEEILEWSSLADGDGYRADGNADAGAAADRATAGPRSEPAVRPAIAGAPTIPVPPRHDGGFVGGVTAVGALGLEMALAVLHGPVALGLEAGSRGMGSALRGVAGLVRWAAISFVCGGVVAGLLVVLLLR